MPRMIMIFKPILIQDESSLIPQWILLSMSDPGRAAELEATAMPSRAWLIPNAPLEQRIAMASKRKA
jgi:hypothetical protein